MDGETPQAQRSEVGLDLISLTTAHRAVMLDDLNQTLANNRAAKQAHDKTFLPNYNTPEEAVIHIGDIHNETSKTNEPPKKSGLSPLASGLLGAALAATGIGIPAAFMIGQALKSAPTVINPTTPGDGNTKYQLNLLP